MGGGRRRGEENWERISAMPNQKKGNRTKEKKFFLLSSSLLLCVSSPGRWGKGKREREEGSFPFLVQEIQRLMKGKNISYPAYTGNQTMIAFSIYSFIYFFFFSVVRALGGVDLWGGERGYVL